MPKVNLIVSWTAVESRSTEVEVELTDSEVVDLAAGYDYQNEKLLAAVRKVEGNDVEFLHDEVDHVEVEEE